MFKKIPFATGFEVNRLGQIRNIKTVRILKQRADKNNYLNVNIRDSETGKQHTVRTHRAVAACFVKGYHVDLEVDHINGDKRDNSPGNLKWVTPEKNKKLYWSRQSKTA